jgi:hypothetical protein
MGFIGKAVGGALGGALGTLGIGGGGEGQEGTQSVYGQTALNQGQAAQAAAQGQLMAQLAGTTPSVAQLQNQQMLQQAQAQQFALANTQAATPAALRAAQMNAGQLAVQANQAGLMNRAQEQQNAALALGQLGGNQVNQGATLLSAGQARQDKQGQGFGQLLNEGVKAAGGLFDKPEVGADGKPVKGQSVWSGIGNAAGKIGGFLFSDENAKQNIKSSRKEMSKFAEALAAKSFEYKTPGSSGAAPGKRYGILAQDLETTEVGRSLVFDTPEGKKIDVAQGLGAALAAIGELHKKIESK